MELSSSAVVAVGRSRGLTLIKSSFARSRLGDFGPLDLKGLSQLKYKNHPNHLGYHAMDKHRVCGILVFVHAALSNKDTRPSSQCSRQSGL